MIFKIVLRNLLRHKRRTFFSSITIAVGITIFILMDSLLAGMDTGAIDNMVNLSTGAAKIFTKEYENNKQTLPLSYGIKNINEIEQTIQKDQRVTGITRRTQFLAQLSNYSEMTPVIGTVIDKNTDTTVFATPRYLQGSYFSGSSEREIILGAELAKSLGVKVGDYITLYALTRYDSHNADEFLIKGLISSTDPSINGNAVFITYQAADEFLDLEDLVTEVDISVKRSLSLHTFIKDVQKVKKSFQSQFPELTMNTFMDSGAGFFQVSKTKALFGYIFLVVILLIAGVGIFNSVFMSVYERIREIGVLRAHGMKPSEITWLFILEGIVTGLLGSTLGLFLGTLGNLYLTIIGFPLDKIAGSPAGGSFPVWGTIYGTWNVSSMVFVFLFGIIVASVASVSPARTASRIQVTRALRFS